MEIRMIIKWCRYLNYVAAFGVLTLVGYLWSCFFMNHSSPVEKPSYLHAVEDDDLDINFMSIIFSVTRWFVLPVLSLFGVEILKLIVVRFLPRLVLQVGAAISYPGIAVYAAGFIDPNNLSLRLYVLITIYLVLLTLSLLSDDPFGTIDVGAAYILVPTVWKMAKFLGFLTGNDLTVFIFFFMP